MAPARLVTMLSIAVLSAAPLVAQEVAGPQWQRDLETQLRHDQKCLVTHFTRSMEHEVAGKPFVMSRAHCEDGRAFGAARNAAEPRFKVRECVAAEC